MLIKNITEKRITFLDQALAPGDQLDVSKYLDDRRVMRSLRRLEANKRISFVEKPVKKTVKKSVKKPTTRASRKRTTKPRVVSNE